MPETETDLTSSQREALEALAAAAPDDPYVPLFILRTRKADPATGVSSAINQAAGRDLVDMGLAAVDERSRAHFHDQLLRITDAGRSRLQMKSNASEQP